MVLYPEKNDAIPDHLKCRVIFQDNSEHIYRIPTVKVQTYSLEEIKEKHLTMFIPYTILRLRPLLKIDRKHYLTQKELTEFVEEIIFVLKEELFNGYLTEVEYHDYIRLFRFAADRVLSHHQQMREEVHRMTEPLIRLPSMIIKELQAEIADQKAELEGKEAELEDKEAELEDKEAELKRKEAEIKRLQKFIAQNTELEAKEAELKSKEAEIQRLQKLVDQLSANRHML